VHARAADMVVVDHGGSGDTAPPEDDDPFYRQFQVPDDLIW